MILIKPDKVGIANLKFLLLCFENISGLKINFNKSEVLVMGTLEAKKNKTANLHNCKLAQFPISDLLSPISGFR